MNEFVKELADEAKTAHNAMVAIYEKNKKLSDELGEITIRKAVLEAEFKAAIIDELDEEGKKKYSNETKRSAELERRLAGSGSHTQMQERIKELKDQIANSDIDLMKLKFTIKYNGWLIDSMNGGDYCGKTKSRSS